jgi:hypothetical protein
MLTLEGCGAFDAAVHCAAVSAGLLANRNKRKRDAPPSVAAPPSPSAPAPSPETDDADNDAEMTQEVAPEPTVQRRRTSSRQAANKRAGAPPVQDASSRRVPHTSW